MRCLHCKLGSALNEQQITSEIRKGKYTTNDNCHLNSSYLQKLLFSSVTDITVITFPVFWVRQFLFYSALELFLNLLTPMTS